jgi:hypothetical protein
MCLIALTVAAFNVLTIGDCAPPQSSRICPALPTYSRTFQKKLAAEIRAMPEDAAAPIFILDSSKLRDAIRACQKK